MCSATWVLNRRFESWWVCLTVGLKQRRVFTFPDDLSLRFHSPLWCKQKWGGGSHELRCDLNTQCLHLSLESSYRRKAKEFPRFRGHLATWMFWEFAVVIADSAVGRKEICSSSSELLIKLLRGQKELLWRWGKRLGCQKIRLHLKVVYWTTSEIRVMLYIACYTINFRWVFQLHPDTGRSSEGWLDRGWSWISVSRPPHWSWFSWRTAWAGEIQKEP